MKKRRDNQYFLLHSAKRETMELPVSMDESQMARLNERMAEVRSEALGLERQKKELSAPINKRLAELRQEESSIDSQRKSSQTMAMVQVEERASLEEGIAWKVRLDTGLEVPNTRRALTPSERMAVAPAGEGAEPTPLFARRGEDAGHPEDEDEEEGEAAPAGPWTAPVGAFDGARVEESLGGDGVRLYTISVGDGSALGPFEYADGFRDPAGRSGRLEEAERAMAESFHEEGLLPLERFYTAKFFKAANDAVAVRAAELAKASDVIPFGEDGFHALYSLTSHPGWAAYVRDERLFFRPPEGEGGADVGPFVWNSTGKMLDAEAGADVSKEWMDAHSKLLDEADTLVESGKVAEPLKSLEEGTPTAPSAAPSAEGSAGEVQAADEMEAPSEERSQASVEDVVRKLSDSARKVVRALDAAGTATTEVLSNRAHVQSGKVLPGLEGKGLAVLTGESWKLTPLGAEVASVLGGKKRLASVPIEDVTY